MIINLTPIKFNRLMLSFNLYLDKTNPIIPFLVKEKTEVDLNNLTCLLFSKIRWINYTY